MEEVDELLVRVAVEHQLASVGVEGNLEDAARRTGQAGIGEAVLVGLVIFGLITATAGRIWVENKVDFSETKNLITTAAAVIAGAGDLTLQFGGFTLGGIGTATFGAILLYALLDRRKAGPEDNITLPAP